MVTGLTSELRHRLELAGGDYPPLYPVVILTASVIVTIVAAAQRFPFDRPWWVLAGLGCAVVTLILDFTIATKTTACALMIVGTSCFLMDAVPTDAAPVQLAIITAISAAMQSLRTGLIVCATSMSVVVLFGIYGGLQVPVFYLSAIACGWLLGYMVLIQQRLADNRARVLRSRAENAAMQERRRIAREIHDIIAHSLSITMLNVTGARRALEQDADIDDAVDALRDAERQGRQAMSEIRNIVHLLGSDESSPAPTPGADDLQSLIDDYRKAGVDVSFDARGDVSRVSATVGTAVYRIAQESLANVVKHSAAQRASVTVSVGDDTVVQVQSPCPTDPHPSRDGTGITGMMQRAHLLGGTLEASRTGDLWSVRAELPTRADASEVTA
ncbi:histidine kinase dimerization and phosphoacceptor region [Gordonia bronchialis DSM 43247]|uniref:histidine kinase n=1 Tax=Gordonia bronchialis (strain ATCC 25592 / DSM 43247 / BCRC 13721 / JCM 3198 / KCTC 3076 / NBRC 16047 / NCTC 10667) TaxID=526226 RepID=D0LE75_GORB4|nr:histidine kinase dimerization and phosphoacceptor region [Gordonia bronchialis DSM 43247]STQ65608.1 Oxygen sensor histidine kinase nreB [Gordonia bronchialis]